MPNRALKIYFDGGCRPNPGRMETAVVARAITHHRRDCGYGSNNDAEWLALIHAVEVANSISARDIILLGDSAVVVRQANGLAKCRSSALLKHHAHFQTLHSQFDRIRIRHISRHQNLAGIFLARARWS